jgi:hypothetical protein
MKHHGFWRLATIQLAAYPFVLLPINSQSHAEATAYSIGGFLECANPILKASPAPGKHSVADTVSCLPKECTVTLTDSTESAQKACTLAGVKLPRVIFECPGGEEGKIKFRPSYLMCPVGSRALDIDEKTRIEGIHHVELGHDTTKVVLSVEAGKESTGAERLADVPINPGRNFAPGGTFSPITPKDVLNFVAKPVLDHGSKHCNEQCHLHEPVNPRTGASVVYTEKDVGKDFIGQPRSPFSTVPAPIIFNTTPPGKLTPATAAARKVFIVNLCAKIKDKKADITKAAEKEGNENASRDVAIALDLCNKIAAKFSPAG